MRAFSILLKRNEPPDCISYPGVIVFGEIVTFDTTSRTDSAYHIKESSVDQGVFGGWRIQDSCNESTGGFVKKLSMLLMLASLAVIPFAIWKAVQSRRFDIDENTRYDINDYLAEEGL
jgi:hypothetical protein